MLGVVALIPTIGIVVYGQGPGMWVEVMAWVQVWWVSAEKDGKAMVVDATDQIPGT